MEKDVLKRINHGRHKVRTLDLFDLVLFDLAYQLMQVNALCTYFITFCSVKFDTVLTAPSTVITAFEDIYNTK